MTWQRSRSLQPQHVYPCTNIDGVLHVSPSDQRDADPHSATRNSQDIFKSKVTSDIFRGVLDNSVTSIVESTMTSSAILAVDKIQPKENKLTFTNT